MVPFLSVNTYDNEANTLITHNQFSIFIVGAGGFGGKKGSEHEKVRTQLLVD